MSGNCKAGSLNLPEIVFQKLKDIKIIFKRLFEKKIYWEIFWLWFFKLKRIIVGISCIIPGSCSVH